RPEVHVLIQLEPRAQEQVTLEDPGLHVGVADRAQEDRVHLSQTRELVVGKRVGRPQVTLSTQVEVDDLDVEPLDGAHGFEDLQAFAHDLRPGTVAGDHPDRVGHGMTSAAGSTGSWGPATRSARLMAARYARALASTTSTDTPRPVTRRPSTSSWTTTSPSASD